MRKYFYLAAVVVCISSCSRNPVTGKRELMLISESQEIAMGKEADPSIVAEYGLYQDDKLQAFINEKGKQMAAISHRPNLPYSFKILDSPIVNAFAVPGGYVYFTRGIMAHFNNEAEFAGVLGHEIGHITARHSASQQSKQLLAQVAFIGGMIASEDFRQLADATNTGLSLLFLKFGRSDESESDKLGVDYSSKIGYNADEMADFFLTLKKMGGGAGSIPTFLSTHPDPADRYNKVKQYSLENHKTNNIDPSTLKIGKESYLKMIDGIIYGEDPKQGYVEGNAFYHPEMLFYFTIPQGWQTINSPSQVQMAPADGKALMLLQMESATNLEQAATNVIQRNAITVQDKVNLNVNGNNAIALYGTIQETDQATGQKGPLLKLMCYLIQYNGNIYKMIGLTKNEDFNAYFSAMQSTMKSFAKLSDQAKINKLPQRIKIVPVKKTGTLQQAMADYNMKADKMEELSLLNGLELTASINAGELVKILELRK